MVLPVFSAGILPFRRRDELEMLVAHPGGPLWANRHEGSWSIVKGMVEPGEDPYDAARREFEEETGWRAPVGAVLELGEVIQRSGKRVVAWAIEADYDPETLAGDTVTMPWRGRLLTFPEIDVVRWAAPDEARMLLNPAQRAFVDRLLAW
jgi:predicted NUDIX family NTP pyrophosphohydrolase